MAFSRQPPFLRATLSRSAKNFAFALLILGVSNSAIAAFSCSGILTQAERDGFSALFNPAYSPSLSHTGGAINPTNFSKKLSVDALKVALGQKERVAIRKKLSASNATWLKGALNNHAADSIPGWLATAIGVVWPAAWVGLAADVLFQVVNGATADASIKAANLAGVVSEGGEAGILELVVNDSSGKPKFFWAYVYSYSLNGKFYTARLGSCVADVVVA
jgi:hypothetical protein